MDPTDRIESGCKLRHAVWVGVPCLWSVSAKKRICGEGLKKKPDENTGNCSVQPWAEMPQRFRCDQTATLRRPKGAP